MAASSKKTQQSVHYRRGSPIKACGNCVNYWHRDTHKVMGGCTKVTGGITTYGVCDIFTMLKNPFGPLLDKQTEQQIEEWFASKVAEKSG